MEENKVKNHISVSVGLENYCITHTIKTVHPMRMILKLTFNTIMRRGAHQWNELLETCRMKYEIFVWCNKSIYFKGTAHTMKQETYVSWNIFLWNSLTVLCEEILHNFRCCCVFHWFKWEEYNKLLEIYFLNVHWGANMLHAIYL